MRRSQCCRLQAISCSSWPVSVKSPTWCVEERASASSFTFPDANLTFCQNGPDLRLNSQTCSAPASAAWSKANWATSLPIPVPRSAGLTATLRRRTWRPSALHSKPAVPRIRPVLSSRKTHKFTEGEPGPLRVRSAMRRNSVISQASLTAARIRSFTPQAWLHSVGSRKCELVSKLNGSPCGGAAKAER